ncbi:MAG: zinc ribbon domain-containing protein [Phycisphaerae bacterium]|nr:zinc ribbon domain-containing protein [Phycisphaerae bacterium]
MPVYEYLCDSCGTRFEHLARTMQSREKTRCPQCGSTGVERQHSAFAARQGATSPGADGNPCSRCVDGQCPRRMTD